jgi:hypothetical protein
MSLIWSQMVQIFCVLSENHLRYLWEKQRLTCVINGQRSSLNHHH